ncbi:IDEAL domain-containing protein [Aquisalibacillus elongatus]|uniref:IDEAL domain-containing protein n=1 Tax=Aquisalibacillus elongatus TaxID=485577 RepID=A0A3N5BKD3_9BACI|nr:IDEAL domain-containing protein [Aquisalibacillus elongatus]RPF50148.1 IDEAL domain-containing protein [Aquisalibacillus elongatus]
MKKQVTSYVLIRYQFPKRVAIKAKREVPYDIKLAARLVLDELVFMWNKNALEEQINIAIDQDDQQTFHELSKRYAKYL